MYEFCNYEYDQSKQIIEVEEGGVKNQRIYFSIKCIEEDEINCRFMIQVIHNDQYNL